MIIINNILKERLTDKLNIKERYKNINNYHIHENYRKIYKLDNFKHCLYIIIEFKHTPLLDKRYMYFNNSKVFVKLYY